MHEAFKDYPTAVLTCTRILQILGLASLIFAGIQARFAGKQTKLLNKQLQSNHDWNKFNTQVAYSSKLSFSIEEEKELTPLYYCKPAGKNKPERNAPLEKWLVERIPTDNTLQLPYLVKLFNIFVL